MEKVKKILWELIPYIGIIVLIIIVRIYIITPVRVDGASMNRTLEDGDILLLYKMAKINRFDIVVLDEEYDNEIIIKRISGLPGETVEIRNNKIYINGEVIEDEYAYGDTGDYDEITLGDDEYFILGDNRPISKDSRYFGPIKEDDLMGEVVLRIWPFSGFGTV